MQTTAPLPADFYRPERQVETATCSFALHIPAVGAEPPASVLAVAFAIALSRRSGKPECLLELRSDVARHLLLPTAPQTSTKELFNHAARGRERLAGPSRDPASVIVSWLDSPSARVRLQGAALHLACAPAGDGYQGTLLYDSNQFKATTIQRLAGQVAVLLAHLPEYLDAPIANLPLMLPAERAQLEALGTGASEPPGEEFAHQLFERQAALAPDAPAVRYRDQLLTYEQLNQRANAVAHALGSRGIGIECRVMVCMHPSLDIAVALLGILKAGAVYVPLDPSYPPARIQALLADTRPVLIITAGCCTDSLPLEGIELLRLDELHGNGAPRFDNPNHPVEAEQTASIYYTSGTTGLPKGAMASQSNLRHYLTVARDRYGLCAADVMPAVARFSFSISMFELMSPLIAGGTLVILEREHVLDLARMCQTLREVTIFHIGPSLLKTLIAYIQRTFTDDSHFSNVRHASSGGDMVPVEVLEALKKIFTRAEVFVIYGCSEISCMGCTYPVSRARQLDTSHVGNPFPNTRFRLLDGERNLVPAGTVGEVYFSGEGVVKGYLNRPELTRERFMTWEGRRYYRTGDMGRISEEGALQLLGRQDFQVQLRGMRIELGEIEHHLRRAPLVKDAVVVAKEDPHGEKSLVAYIVGHAPADPAAAPRLDKLLIRDYLRTQLPEYMIPVLYIELDKLPLNHNSKLDRKALPQPTPEDRRLQPVVIASAPRNPMSATEARMAAIWCEELALDKVGLEDHFFDLGGDSLKALELIVRVRSALGVTLDGLEIIRETLGTLAALCDGRLGAAAPAVHPRATRLEPIEIFHFGPGRSLYGIYQAATRLAGDRAVLICGPLGPEAARAHFVLQRLASRLAASGIPSLRFDYYGQGDSLGDLAAGSCARWEEDVVSACRELRSRSGAERITAIGVRLGASLLTRSLGRIGLDRAVFWDPVCDGECYVGSLLSEQSRYLNNVRHRRRWRGAPAPSGCAESSGATYSLMAMEELRDLVIAPGANTAWPSLRWLETSRSSDDAQRFEALTGADRSSRLQSMEAGLGWGDIERIEQNMPDVGISKALLDMVLE